MYAISNNYKNLLETSLSFSPKSKIVVDGTTYDGSVIKTYPKISHKNSAMIGGFPTKTCTFDIYDVNGNLDFEGKEITVYRGLDVNGMEWIPQGIFVPTADKITTDISTKTISFNGIQDKSQLFDATYTTNISWLDGSTHTGLEIVQDICSTLGITLETTTFNWYNYSFKQPNFPSNITYREVISRLAEIGGSIAYISRTGGLVIKSQTSTGHSVVRKRYSKLTREKQFGQITVVVLGKDGVDDDIIYPSTLPSEVVEWKILDNPFVDLYREEMIETVASYIIGQSIIPFTLTDFVDGFYLDLNDTVQVTDRNNNTFTAIILNYESTSRIKASVGADTQTETQTNYNIAGSTKESMRKVISQVNHITGEITNIVSEIGDRSDKETSITQDIDTIAQTVQNNMTFKREASGTTYVEFENAKAGNLLRLSIKGQMSLLYPNNDLYPSDDLYPLDSYLVIEDEDGNKNKILLPVTYLNYLNENACDEFVVENNQAKIIRRVKSEIVESSITTGTDLSNQKIIPIEGIIDIKNMAWTTLLTTSNDYSISVRYKPIYDGGVLSAERYEVYESKTNGVIYWLEENATNHEMTYSDLSAYLLATDFGVVTEVNEDLNTLLQSRKTELSILSNQIEEELGEVIIDCVDDYNKIYLESFFDKALLYNVTYVISNDYTETFVTDLQLKTSIEQSENTIKDEVYGKYTDENGEVHEISGVLESKLNTEDLVSELNASYDVIKLQSNRFSMTSDYSSISADGEASFKKGDIGGFLMDSTSFSKELSGIYDYSSFDLQLLRYALLNYINLSQDSLTQDILDADDDNSLDSGDLLKIRQIILGQTTNDKNVQGSLYINSNNPKDCFVIEDDSGNVAISLGLGGLNSNEIVAQNIVCTNTKSTDTSSITGVFIDGIGGNIRASGTVTQSSLESRKKNIEKYSNALSEIKKIDIYKYNLIEEKNDCKKHLGFVIGDKYNYSETITNNENNQVDLYSMISLCMQAIKEQQEIIEKLEERVEELENEISKNNQ